MKKLLAAATAAAACAILTATPVLALDDDPHGRAGSSTDTRSGATASTAPATPLPWGIGHAAATALHGVDPDRLDASLMRLYSMGRGSRVAI